MSKESKIALLILLLGGLGAGLYWLLVPGPSVAAEKKTASENKEKILLPASSAEAYRRIPEVRSYLEDLRAAIARGSGVLPLRDDELDGVGKKVQDLLLRNEEFLADTRLKGKVMHNDMMRILPAIVSAVPPRYQSRCRRHRCYQAEKYNFVTNTTTRAIVDTEEMKVLSVERFPGTQPDISRRLTKVAQAIALEAPEVRKELGHTPSAHEITMANVRGSMKESPCEDTTHLCVAPTFADHAREQALWAVVDLTDLRLAAAKWAGLGKTTTPACIGERSLQNRYIMENYCQKDSLLERDGWSLRYRLTGSDGLEIRDVRFRGVPVIKSAKIVDWHVSYRQKGASRLDTTEPMTIEGRQVEFVRGENDEFLFGYNDAMGCPLFSTSVVLAFNGPQIREIPGGKGFALSQDFRNPKWPMACNYRYENRFEFYPDGSFRIVGVNKGRGCGDNAIYRPVMRIDLDLGAERFYAKEPKRWELWTRERGERVREGKYPYAVVSAQERRGYYLEPNRGQFGDHSRGDHATLFVTRFHPEEGDRDLLTLGSCCKLDEDGPERFVNGESIVDEDLVLWYTPHIRNDDRPGHEYCWADTVIGADGNLKIRVWPCTVGPRFVPIPRGELPPGKVTQKSGKKEN